MEGAFNSTGHIHLTSDIANLTVIVLSLLTHSYSPADFNISLH